MTTLVTGANGLLATNTILALLARGHRVRGLIRDPSKFALPAHPYLELVRGDITCPESLVRAMEACHYVIHCAATTDQGLLRYADYHYINVLGTENVLKAAQRCGIRKIVYVGTANTFGFGTFKRPGDESMPPKTPFSEAWYARSKLEGQALILASGGDVAVTVVSPTFMIGPYDGKPSSGAIIRMGYGKRVVFHPPGGKNFVNVADAAKGVVAALEQGQQGQAYLLAGENLSYREFFRKLNRQVGQRQWLIQVPASVLLAAGYIGDACRWMGIRTALSSTNMKILCLKNYYTGAKAERLLGVRFRPIDHGINEAIEWFKAHRMLPR